MTGPRKNRNPTRCPQCGCLVIEWPKGSSCCYGCLIQREPQREQRYIRDQDIGERIGCVTSRPSEAGEETNASR